MPVKFRTVCHLLLAIAAFAGIVPQADANNPTIARAEITPSGQLLHVVPLKGDGSTALNFITAVADGATITINGVSVPLAGPIYSTGWPGVAWPLGTPVATYSRKIDDPDPDCSSTGTWVERTPFAGVGGYFNSSGAVNGQYHDSSDPSATRTWTFSGLAPGKYRISAHLWDLVGPGRATHAVYTARDGSGAVLQAFPKDLSTGIFPNIDRVAEGLDLQDLGEVILGAGRDTVAVTLSNAAGSGVLVADALVLQGVAARPASPGDVVTATFPAGTITVAGTGTDAATGVPVTFLTDEGSFPVTPPAGRTMGAGYNLEGVREDWFNQTLANRALASDVWTGNVTLDEHFEMTANAGTAHRTLLYQPVADGLSPRGLYVLPDGVVRCEFNVSGSPFDDPARANVTLRNAYGGRNVIGPATWTDLGSGRWRLEQHVARPAWEPIATRTSEFLPVWTQGLEFVAATPGVVYKDFRWFDARTPSSYKGTAHPDDVARLTKDDGTGWVAAIRSMDILGINGSMASMPGDFSTPADRLGGASSGAYWTIASVDVTEIRPVSFNSPTDADHFNRYFDKSSFNGWVVATVTGDTSKFADGTQAGWSGPVAKYASTFGTNVNLGAIQQVYKIDPTHLLIECGIDDLYQTGTDPATNRATVAATHAVTGTTLRTAKNSLLPLETFLAYCSDVRAPPWINVPHLATDAMADWMAALVIAGTPDGRKVYVEYSNETWNPFFTQYGYFTSMYHYANWLHARDPVANPLDFSQTGPYGWQAHRAAQVQARFRAAFAAAGRDPNLVVRLCGLQTQNFGPTGAVGDQVKAEGLEFDYFVTEDYQDHCPPAFDFQGPDLAASYARLDVDGCIDSLALSAFSGQRDRFVRAHTDILAARGVTAKHIAYEGGWSQVAPPFGRTTPQRVRLSAEIMANRRMYRLTAAFLSRLQAMGYALDCRYTYAYYSIPSSTLAWSDLYSPYSAAGTGSPGENKNPFDWPNSVSQPLGGRKAWATGVDLDASPAASTPTPGSVMVALKAAIAAQIDAMTAASATGSRKVVDASSAAARAILDLADQVTGYLASPAAAPAAP